MRVNQYLISIQQQGMPRYDAFFEQDCFDEDDFKVFGVVGAKLPTSTYFELGVKNKKRPLAPSELGCTLSHLKALEDFIASDAQYAYIFEDDVKHKKMINFDADLSFLGEGFIASLGGVGLQVCQKVKGEVVGHLFDQPMMKINPYFYEHICYAMGYIVDQKSAKAIVQYHQNPQIFDHWKDFLNENTELNYYMSDLLDHPDVSDLCNVNSGLESERKSLFYISDKPKVLPFLFWFWRYRIFKVKKRYYGLTNQFYPKSDD